MSFDGPARAPLDEDLAVQAALVWDVPTLRRTKEPGAEAFIEAFGPHAPRWWGPPMPSGSVLEIAAMAIVADRSGERDEALATYEKIGGGFWADLLRLALRGWSSYVTETQDIHLAADVIERLPTPTALRALLAVKFATFAYDKGDRPLLERLLREAVTASPANS